MRRLLLAAVLFTALVLPAHASAAPGDLTFIGCVYDRAVPFCEASTPPGVGAAAYPVKSVVSPDGSSVFTIGGDPLTYESGLMRFTRAADGRLSFASCFLGPACAQFPDGENRMDQPKDLVISPDGKDLYVISVYSYAVVHFRLDARGDPVFIDCIPCGPLPNMQRPSDVFGSPTTLAISPDGKNVYVGMFSGASVVTLNRDSNGSLSFRGCFDFWVDCDEHPPLCDPQTDSCRGPPADDPEAIAVSGDGKNVYVAEGEGYDHFTSSVTRFTRDAGGSLRFADCLGVLTAGCRSEGAQPIRGPVAMAAGPATDVYVSAEANPGGPDGRYAVSHLKLGSDGNLRVADCISQPAFSGCTPLPPGVEGLQFPRSLAISFDAKSLYVGARNPSSIHHFRLGANGAMSFAGCYSGGGCARTGLCCGPAPVGITLSPDGLNLYGHAEGYMTIARREPTSDPPVLPPRPPPDTTDGGQTQESGSQAVKDGNGVSPTSTATGRPKKACVVPRTVGLRVKKAKRRLVKARCVFKIRGRGRVRSSVPKAGQRTTKVVVIRAKRARGLS